MPHVDTHAHVFLTSLPMASHRRYTPASDCSTEDYLATLSAHDVSLGVLVQPSFLGTDNTYLLRALDRYGSRLRGIAVVEASISDDALVALDELGVVGIRFNMIGRDVTELATPDIRALLARIEQLGWQVEVQARGRDLPRVFDAVERFRGPLVIDHFGLPDPLQGVRDQGFRALLSQGPKGRVFVKMSAGYRCGSIDVASCAGALQSILGPRRLLWGSDWPFTQFEKSVSFAGMVSELHRSTPDLEARNIMDTTALDLFRFSREFQSLGILMPI